MHRPKIDSLKAYHDFLLCSDPPSPGEDVIEINIKSKAQDIRTQNKTVPEIFNECIEIIEKIKSQLSNFDKIKLEKEDSNFLNNILINESVLNYSKSSTAIAIVKKKKLFADYSSIDYILTKLKVFLHLLTLNKKTRKYFFKILAKSCENQSNINQKLMLIERFLLQLTFLKQNNRIKLISNKEIKKYKAESLKLIEKILADRPDNTYAKLICEMIECDKGLTEFRTIYSSNFLRKAKNTSLMQQIKQRHLCERLGLYNVAFNHLLNEFQNLTESVFFDGKTQDSIKIRNKLKEQKFKTSEILFICDFFKRRNQNSISHSNYTELGFWAVSEKEYYDYKDKVLKIIEKIVKST